MENYATKLLLELDELTKLPDEIRTLTPKGKNLLVTLSVQFILPKTYSINAQAWVDGIAENAVKHFIKQHQGDIYELIATKVEQEVEDVHDTLKEIIND